MDYGMKKKCTGFLRLLIIMLLAIAFILPLLLMLSTSFRTSSGLYSGLLGIIPRSITFDNYKTAFTLIPYSLYMWNTALITILNVVGQLMVTPMIAYSLAKIKWPGAGIIFSVILSTMMLPYFTIMVPLYKIWGAMSLTGTKWPLIICAFFGNPLYIVILRQFMANIPNSLLEGAKIDGCNEFQKFLNVAVPLAKPAITAIAIFTFLQTWSDYLGPSIYLSNPKDYTLSLGLKAFINQYTIDWPSLMAASTIFIMPVIVLFAIFQKNFVEGISTTGLK